VPLFSRSTRQVTVTDAGKEFAALAERLLNDLRIGAENVREMAAQPRGQIIVASVVSLAGAVLPGLVADYSRRFPGIELHLREGLHNMVTDEIRNGLADFGIGYVEDAPRSFATEDLGVETFHLVMRRDDVLARRTRIGLPALTDVPASWELGRNPQEQQILKIVANATEVGKMIMAPPGMPADRVQALRRAFDATMKDPEFVAELNANRVELGPMPGEALQKLVAELGAASPEIIDKVKAIYPLN